MALLLRLVPAALLVGSGLSAAVAHAGQSGGPDGMGGSAFGIAAQFVSGGTATGVQPVPTTFGQHGWRKGQWSGSGSVEQTLLVASDGKPIAVLQITAGNVHVGTRPSAFGVDNAGPAAGGSIGSLQITLQPYPPPLSGPLPPPLLSIVASDVTWQASDTAAASPPPVLAGSVGFTSLQITGSLINNDTINGTGPQSPNDSVDIPLASGYVRITLDQQVIAGAVSCTSTCVFNPTGITVEALAIHLDQVSLSGQAVTGDITVGEAEAHAGW